MSFWCWNQGGDHLSLSLSPQMMSQKEPFEYLLCSAERPNTAGNGRLRERDWSKESFWASGLLRSPAGELASQVERGLRCDPRSMGSGTSRPEFLWLFYLFASDNDYSVSSTWVGHSAFCCIWASKWLRSSLKAEALYGTLETLPCSGRIHIALAVPGDSFSLDFLLLSYIEVFTFYENSLLEHLFCVSLKNNNWTSVAFLWKLSELCSLFIPHKQKNNRFLLSTCSQKVKARITCCLLLVLKWRICPRISNREWYRFKLHLE